MSIKGFNIGGTIQRYDYDALDNKPSGGGGLTEAMKQALLQCFQKVAYIDANGQTYYQALYDALYTTPRVLTSISASYTQSGEVLTTDSLDSLRTDIVVTAYYSDSTSETVTNYTMSGTLAAGTSIITVYYDGMTDTFSVTVTAVSGTFTVSNQLTGCTTSNSATTIAEGDSYTATITASSGYTLTGATVSVTMGGNTVPGAYSNGTISIANVTGDIVITVTAVAITVLSISAVYTQSGTVYDTDTLDSLKADLVVTAVYSDSSTQTVPAADYTLSGTLTVGTSTITVSYSGKTTTFSVTVTAHVVNGWLYHFDQSLISSGTEDFGFQGVQEYTAGRLGNDWAYYHRVATPGDTATDPFGIYALNLITAPNFSGDFTISFWMATQEANHFHPFTYGIYGNGNTPSSRYFSGGITTDNSAWSISQSSATNKYAGICMWALQSTGKFTISFHNAELTASSQVIMTIPSSFDTTQWHHYALTRKGTTVRFFIDGQLVWHATASYSTIYAANQICVGNLFKQTSATAQQLDPVSRGEKIQDLYIAESCKWDAAFDPATITY